MTRHSSAFEAIPDSGTPVLPLPGTSAERDQRPIQQPVNRIATIEPGVGSFHIVYRDEHGYPLLDWECDYRVSAEDRQWLRQVQQGVGDQLAAVTARPTPFPLPCLLR